MKIALIQETKHPVDNRVALTPEQMAMLQRDYPNDRFVVQSSNLRAYNDDQYRAAGIPVVEDVADCDVLMGIKEVKLDCLLPRKHYFFFGHFAKMQAYNLPLVKTLMERKITFTDYEYLVDEKGQRVCAFGWWAGVVGVYYTLRGYGLRHHLYELPPADRTFTLEGIVRLLKNTPLPHIKLVVTGAGRVSQGAQHLLREIGALHIDEETFLQDKAVETLAYCVADVDRLVKRTDGGAFSWDDFTRHPQEYRSDFMRWGRAADALLCAHFWAPDAPVYLSEADLADPTLRIRMIGDVTCDIRGSVKSTLRASTHDAPYYDYNPATQEEEEAFSSPSNITVMAVDTCPNALALDSSAYFGDALLPHVLRPLLNRTASPVIDGATILREGKLTPKFDYLKNWAFYSKPETLDLIS